MKYQLISELTEPTMIEQVLVNRGFYKEDIQHFLNVNETDVLDPLLIANIEEGAKLLIKHIKAGSKIFMPIDSDCDGFTSAALFINYLNCLFPHYAQSNIIYKAHQGKEHGIIESAVPDNVELVIAIDSSSNDYEVHKNLADRGIDVLVIDHHEAERISEYACVLNNQLCDYPTKSLSGVGMAYKFCCYIDSLLGRNEAEKFIDLVALGLVADMMDQRDCETFYLINQGLKNIRNPYFKEMVTRNERQFEGGITPISVAFYVAPFINAINRSGSYEEKILIFESMLDFRAYELIPSTKRGCKGQVETRVEQAGRTSINVKNRQQKARDCGLETIDEIIKKNNLLDNKILVVPIPEGLVDKNLSGLVANQLASIYQRPTLILRETIKDEVKSWEGSARGYEKSGFTGLKDFLASSGLVMYAEGHQGAFGIGVLDKDLNNFIAWINNELKDFIFDIKYDVDFIFDVNNLTELKVYEIANYNELWGQNISEPLIAIENIKITSDNIRFLGTNGKTLRIDLPNDKISMIKFNLTDEEKEQFNPKEGYIKINAVGHFQKNSWNGYTYPQIQLKDYDIIERIEFYF